MWRLIPGVGLSVEECTVIICWGRIQKPDFSDDTITNSNISHWRRFSWLHLRNTVRGKVTRIFVSCRGEEEELHIFLVDFLIRKSWQVLISPKRRLKCRFIFLGLTYILESSAKAVCLKSSPWCEMWKEDDLYCFRVDFTGFPTNFSPFTQTTQRTLSMQQ